MRVPWLCLARLEQYEVRPQARDALVPLLQLSSAEVPGHSRRKGSRLVGSFEHENTKSSNLACATNAHLMWRLILAGPDYDRASGQSRRGGGSALDQNEVVWMGIQVPQPEASVYQGCSGKIASLLQEFLPGEAVS